MMVVPVAAAAQLASSYRGTLVTASAVGSSSAVAGLSVAHYLDYSPGSAIVLTAIAAYLAAAGAGAGARRLRLHRVARSAPAP